MKIKNSIFLILSFAIFSPVHSMKEQSIEEKMNKKEPSIKFSYQEKQLSYKQKIALLASKYIKDLLDADSESGDIASLVRVCTFRTMLE